ncbi:MAG: hypothetical protein CK426_00935 [Legionella sp.]|nr:MAG: hypothetical protein CK423_09600 [Legionella sp.]PJD99965.1 MAG: hypothetical protein CK426_00935 [Legionella sp.]
MIKSAIEEKNAISTEDNRLDDLSVELVASISMDALLLKNRIRTYLYLFDYDNCFMYQTELKQLLQQINQLNSTEQQFLSMQQIYLCGFLALSQGRNKNDPDIARVMQMNSGVKKIASREDAKIIKDMCSYCVTSFEDEIERLLNAFQNKANEHTHPIEKKAALALYVDLIHLKNRYMTVFAGEKEKQYFIKGIEHAVKRAQPELQKSLSWWAYIENWLAYLQSFFIHSRPYSYTEQSFFKMHQTQMSSQANELADNLLFHVNSTS